MRRCEDNEEFEMSQNETVQLDSQLDYQTFEHDSISHRLSITSSRKKRASNDAQLLLNRISLLKKEEDKAKKRTLKTKQKALEVLLIREEQESRYHNQLAVDESEKYQIQEIHDKNILAENQLRNSTVLRSEEIKRKKKEDARGIKSEKQQITHQILREQEEEYLLKKKKCDDVRRMECLARKRREEEKRQYEFKLKEAYRVKIAREEAEALEAERVVKELERQEAEYIKKLQIVQRNQDEILNTLESLLLCTSPTSIVSPARKPNSPKAAHRKSPPF